MMICTMCKQEKPPDEFNRHSRRANGYDERCKPCRSEYDRKRRASRTSEEYGYDSAIRRSGLSPETVRGGRTRAEILEETRYIYRLRDAMNASLGYRAYEVDHIVELQLGGLHTAENLRILPVGQNVSRWHDSHDPCWDMDDDEIAAWEQEELERLRSGLL